MTQSLHNERKSIKQFDLFKIISLGRNWPFQLVIVLLSFESFNSIMNNSHKIKRIDNDSPLSPLLAFLIINQKHVPRKFLNLVDFWKLISSTFKIAHELYIFRTIQVPTLMCHPNLL